MTQVERGGPEKMIKGWIRHGLGHRQKRWWKWIYFKEELTRRDSIRDTKERKDLVC